MKRLLCLATGLALAAGLTACGGTKRPPAVSTSNNHGRSTSTTSVPDRTPVEPVGEGPDVQPIPSEGSSGRDIDPEGGPLADIHFDYDQSSLSDEARNTLQSHATWLKDHRAVRVTVEGHCDERGSAEYNLALGDQRARTTREFLVSLGIEAARLSAVSFGKERPLETGGGEATWAKNRRAHFAVAQ